jgi:hypothetical protein
MVTANCSDVFSAVENGEMWIEPHFELSCVERERRRVPSVRNSCKLASLCQLMLFGVLMGASQTDNQVVGAWTMQLPWSSLSLSVPVRAHGRTHFVSNTVAVLKKRRPAWCRTVRIRM